ncbi:PhoX family phosphatase [Hahella aquimaris]|uniref:PhoX family protein n=1 Tax=Hahella sp. HNIBRBA332 TaxID=3015983 RepID=UPI00273C3BCB|nr:PhoX family phosphatase [Hahella sp. HNIBRBA332]WLQ12947.1 PhoX family phosphatase [Hahella sp. HNIBRBA332]
MTVQHPQYGWEIKDSDDIPSSPEQGRNFFDILQARTSRRSVLRGFAAGAAASGVSLTGCSAIMAGSDKGELTFTELPHGQDETFHVAPGYEHDVLISWGDKVLADAPAFDPRNQSAQAQSKQFGYNNDFVGFLSLPLGSDNSDHGLLAVNHEYTISELMFPGSPKTDQMSKAQADIDMMAHGLSIIEIKKTDGKWAVVQGSKYNRRITPVTEMRMTGPVAGSDRLRTAISQDGVRTLGTYGNCAGGVTPWGTVLTAEENVQNYFKGDPAKTKEAENYKRFGLSGEHEYAWANYYDRWNLAKSPNEPLHVGWVVEIDPFDPDSKPQKRTALGRCKHEGCNVYVNKDNRVVAYTGDDQRFEYVYKFVSKNKYDPNNRAANMRLLEEGTLYVAEFTDGGLVTWRPLVFGQGPLTAANGFRNQGDVMIDVRKAADLLGATRMDRPEDVEVNPRTGSVFVMLTNNSKRKEGDTNAANPRAKNQSGHIIEMTPPDGDHTADRFMWDMFIVAGNPQTEGAKYHPDISANGWFADPDNCAFDNHGNLWIATDGAYKDGVADGVWACAVSGEARALTKHFLRTPLQAELCGPFFTPDNQSFFCSVQHPGEEGTYDQPTTRWPDFRNDLPPRPSVVAINKSGGGRIGS